MQRVASSNSSVRASDTPRVAIAGSLALVSLSYVLLLAAPVASRQLRSLVGQGALPTLESWLPALCSAGLVLGGGAALLFVLVHIVREAALRPYVCLSPVLAAFAACIMIGLRAQLPLPGVSAEHVAVFALAVAVVGGSLMQHPSVSTQLMGLGFALLPPICLFMVFWTISGRPDPAQALWSLPAHVRAYLAMLTGASFTIATVALLARRDEVEEPELRLPRPPRVPGEMQSFAVELSYERDMEALTKRGLPNWVIATASGLAVLVGFFALKMTLDARSSRGVQVQAVQASEQAKPASNEATLHAVPVPTVEALAVQAPSKVLEQPKLEPPVVQAAAVAVEVAPSAEQPSAVLEAKPVAAAPGEREQTAESAQPSVASSHTRSSRRAHAHNEEKPARAQVRSHERDKAESRRERSHAQQTKPTAQDKPAAVALKSDEEPKIEKSAKKSADGKVAAAEPQPAAAEKAPAKEKPVAPAEPSASSDDSLDELMGKAVKGKGAKKSSVNAGDDPIFGL